MTLGGRFLSTLLGAAVVTGLTWWGWRAIRPLPVLDRDRFEALTAGGRFASAEAMLVEHLARDPAESDANFLLAELLLERPAAEDGSLQRDAERALLYLRRVGATTASQRALARLYEGKALYRLDRWGSCEKALNDALRIDPTVPEAGWMLLSLYYLEGRAPEAARLALRQMRVEPDAHDRAQYLLELVRQDAQPPDAASIVEQLGPVRRAEPAAVEAAVALGLAHIRNSQPEDGFAVLEEQYRRHTDDPRAWAGLMAGHELAGEPEAIAALLGILPPKIEPEPLLEQYRGAVAQWRGDWPAAIVHYRAAIELDPYDPALAFRLGRALRNAGQTEEGDRLLAKHEGYAAAREEVLALYREANAVKTLGVEPHPDLCARMADLRERMLRPEEAAAWRELAGGARSPGETATSNPAADVDRSGAGG